METFTLSVRLVNNLFAVWSILSWLGTSLSAIYVLADLVSLEKCLAWLVLSMSSTVYCMLVGSIRVVYK